MKKPQMVFHLEVFREGGWWLVGQYSTLIEPATIATNYMDRGERCQILQVLAMDSLAKEHQILGKISTLVTEF